MKQFDKQVYGYARGMLEGFGLKLGHVIGIYMGNELENFILQYAASLIGIKAVVIDPSIAPSDMQTIISKENVRVLFVSTRYNNESRISTLHSLFQPELDAAGYNWGYNPIASKRFRSLKYIVHPEDEEIDKFA